MRNTLAPLALLASASAATALLSPSASAPAGCSTDYGRFLIGIEANAKRSLPHLQKRQSDSCDNPEYLSIILKLSGSVLTDGLGRIGAIVANRQLQFDSPSTQANAVYTGGWSVCSNGSLALGGSTVFYECASGGFANLYDQSVGSHCLPITIVTTSCGDAPAAAAAPGLLSGPAQIGLDLKRELQKRGAQLFASVIPSGLASSIPVASLASSIPVASHIGGGQGQVPMGASSIPSVIPSIVPSVAPSPLKSPTPVPQIPGGHATTTSATPSFASGVPSFAPGAPSFASGAPSPAPSFASGTPSGSGSGYLTVAPSDILGPTEKENSKAVATGAANIQRGSWVGIGLGVAGAVGVAAVLL